MNDDDVLDLVKEIHGAVIRRVDAVNGAATGIPFLIVKALNPGGDARPRAGNSVVATTRGVRKAPARDVDAAFDAVLKRLTASGASTLRAEVAKVATGLVQSRRMGSGDAVQIAKSIAVDVAAGARFGPGAGHARSAQESLDAAIALTKVAQAGPKTFDVEGAIRALRADPSRARLNVLKARSGDPEAFMQVLHKSLTAKQVLGQAAKLRDSLSELAAGDDGDLVAQLLAAEQSLQACIGQLAQIAGMDLVPPPPKPAAAPVSSGPVNAAPPAVPTVGGGPPAAPVDSSSRAGG